MVPVDPQGVGSVTDANNDNICPLVIYSVCGPMILTIGYIAVSDIYIVIAVVEVCRRKFVNVSRIVNIPLAR